MRKLVFAVLLGAVVVACSDQTTAPNDQSPAFRAAQGDRSEWTYQWSFGAVPRENPSPIIFIPCINGGLGELAGYWGPEGAYFAKVTVTPSGNVEQQGYIPAFGDGIDHYLGQTTGDDWASQPFAWVGHTKYHFQANGLGVIQESAWETLTNQRTGERVRVLFQWVYHWGNNGAPEFNTRDYAVISCHALPH
jgi:hypothetical protein